MEELAAFIGSWDVEAFGGHGDTTFEWVLGGAFVLQRASADHPDAPEGLMVITPNDDGTYTQHYFDSRGVVRLYAMEFDGRVWKLERSERDFSALDFSQRFTGEFSEDANTIEGRFEIKEPGADWRLDFEITYRRR